MSNLMAPKKRQRFSRSIPMKKQNQAHDKAPFNEEEEEEEEDIFEMERNFALLNKHTPVEQSEMNEKDEEETSVEGSDESGDDDDDDDDEYKYSKDFVTEPRQPLSTVMTGLEDSRNQDCRRSHTKTTDLSTLSFEEILKLQNKVGRKACNKYIHSQQKKRQHSEPAKRVNKDRPQELSSKKPVSFLRKAGSVKAPILRDPRFDDLSGEFKPEVFSQTYKFISDIRHQEAEMVKKKLKKVKSAAKKQELKSLLKRMENQKRSQQRQEQQREKELHYKRKQRELVGEGHKPFYLKKSDKKKLELAEKYNDLKRSGKLQNFLSKKRKRNAGKDRRKLP